MPQRGNGIELTIKLLYIDRYGTKKEQTLLAQIRASLQCPVVIAACRQRPQDFTRLRLLSFGRLCLVVLRGHKLSFQNALNKVFHALGDVFGVPTPSAYSHARQKLKPEVFTHLQRSLCAGFYQLYEADEQVQRWRGHRLLATDGTYLTVPDTPQTRAHYTVQTNQHAGADCVQAQCGVLYDLRNDLGLRLHLSARQSETRVLRDDLWRATQPGDVIVLDRAYADYSLLACGAATPHRALAARALRRVRSLLAEPPAGTNRHADLTHDRQHARLCGAAEPAAENPRAPGARLALER